jgi:hypothetical protein
MMEQPQASSPKPKTEKTGFQKMRDFVDRVPNSVKMAAKAGAFIAGKLMSEQHKDPLEDVAEAQDLNQERMVMEHKLDQTVQKSQAAFEAKLGKTFAEAKEAVVLDFMAGFKQLTPDAIKVITENTTVPATLFRSPDDQFPSGDQLGSLARSQFTTVYLNSKAYDRHLPTYQWLELVKKVRPDREFPKKG